MSVATTPGRSNQPCQAVENCRGEHHLRPDRGGEIPIFEMPPELLIQLAQVGQYGLRIVGVEEVSGV